MAYEPTEWKSGDVVTSAKLNKIEAGIASGGVLVVTDTEGTLDKTWQEIWNSAPGYIKISANENEKTFSLIRAIGVDSGEYYISTADDNYYAANSASGYPVNPNV